jgi:hypothetical protein
MNSTTEEIKKLKSDDPEYFKMYQRELYKNKLGLKSKCSHCGSIVSLKHMARHKLNQKCINKPLQSEERSSEILKELIKMVKERKITISEEDYKEMFK